jgi:hypothetical protein
MGAYARCSTPSRNDRNKEHFFACAAFLQMAAATLDSKKLST